MRAADKNQKLAAALEAAIPGCRKQSRRSWGGFRETFVRRHLTRLARRCFDTDRYGWWYVPETPIEVEQLVEPSAIREFFDLWLAYGLGLNKPYTAVRIISIGYSARAGK
jgi:hypothetical protein